MGRPAAPAVALAALALAGLGLAQTDPGRGLLGDWGLSSPSEPYTELAFAKPDALPTRASDGAVSVPVWLHNVEGGPRTYHWTATTRQDGGADAIAAGSGLVTLADGASTTVRARIPVTCSGERTRVDVSLGGAHRTIGFWLACEGSGG